MKKLIAILGLLVGGTAYADVAYVAPEIMWHHATNEDVPSFLEGEVALGGNTASTWGAYDVTMAMEATTDGGVSGHVDLNITKGIDIHHINFRPIVRYSPGDDGYKGAGITALLETSFIDSIQLDSFRISGNHADSRLVQLELTVDQAFEIGELDFAYRLSGTYVTDLNTRQTENNDWSHYLWYRPSENFFCGVRYDDTLFNGNHLYVTVGYVATY